MSREEVVGTTAHQQEVTIRFIERWPAHEPRKSDPYYRYFAKAKARLKAQGLLKCNVLSDYHEGPIELHHSVIEFAHLNDVDITKLNALFGLSLDDESFRVWAEGPGNLEPLCRLHHRGQEGVHSLPEPEWNTLRVAKNPHEMIVAQTNTLIPVIKGA